MPRRDDLKTILVLGSGPIKIGQAAEFDFSGSQAVRALREDGYEVILVNSNPATIQNDPEMATHSPAGDERRPALFTREPRLGQKEASRHKYSKRQMMFSATALC